MAFDNKLALISGTDIPIPELQLTIHQPKIKEIALIGDADFFVGVQCLVLNKQMIDQGKTPLADINNFQIFMMVMTEKEAADKKQAVLQLLSLIFPKHKVSFTPRSMIFTQEGSPPIIVDEKNFDFLQNNMKEIFCINSSAMQAQTFNPGDKRAQAIADKLMRARQRVAAQKNENGGSIFVQYVSTLTVGLNSMSLEDCLNLTMYQLFDLIERYMLWINWDLDMKSRLAGGKPESKQDNWMKNIH